MEVSLQNMMEVVNGFVMKTHAECGIQKLPRNFGTWLLSILRNVYPFYGRV